MYFLSMNISVLLKEKKTNSPIIFIKSQMQVLLSVNEAYWYSKNANETKFCVMYISFLFYIEVFYQLIKG